MEKKTNEEWDAWFEEDPRVVRKNPDKSDYVPIGIIEEDLDELDSWHTSNEQFSSFTAGKDTFVTNSLILTMAFGDRIKSFVGGSTMKVEPGNPNQEYRGSLISLSTSNASKKAGNRFGRKLNGRMDTGETVIPVFQLQTVRDLEKIEDFFIERKKELSPEDIKIFKRVIDNREISSYQKLIKIIEEYDKQPGKKRKL